MVLDLMAQLDRESTERNKIEALLRELLDAKRSRKSEQLSADQLASSATRYGWGPIMPTIRSALSIVPSVSAWARPSARTRPALRRLLRNARAAVRLFHGISNASASYTI